jgi:hypothetical protein
MIKSDLLVRYREYVSNGQNIKKPDDKNLMIDTQFHDWPHTLTYHSDGSKVYSFEYEGIPYKATHVWYENPPEGYTAEVLYDNVEYDEGLDKFVVRKMVPLPPPVEEPAKTE